MKEKTNSPIPSGLAAWHFLSRTTFGPRPQDVERANQVSIKGLLDEQLHPENIDDSQVEQRIASLPTLAMSPAELMEDFPAPKPRNNPDARQEPSGLPMSKVPGQPSAASPSTPEMSAAMEADGPRRILMELGREQFWRAAYSQRQLQEVMVHFWMNHFNIYAAKGVDKWLLTSFEHDTIRPHALGNFSDLLAATAQSPAMLFYLDNWLSVAPNAAAVNRLAQRRRGPFAFGGGGLGGAGTWENGRRPQAERRGLNENYARELMELHTLGVDGGYTQQDVREIARCFTGWTIDHPQQGGGFIFRLRLHDDDAKTVLGHKIKGHGGMKDGMEVVQLLAAHRSTAHFISLKLCRHFVADEPPASVVDRTAHTFQESRGDIRSVLSTILNSPEFNSPAAFRAKVKSPFELVASALRSMDAETDAGAPLMGMIMRMGQPLFQYQAPTGFPDRASNWINSGTLLARMNFSMALAANRIRGTQLDLQALSASDDPQTVWDHLVQRALGGSVSPETQTAVMKSLQGLGSADGGNPRAFPKTTLMAALLLGSPEFQRR
jgi:uncharacterized protein (DUF1800 family)